VLNAWRKARAALTLHRDVSRRVLRLAYPIVLGSLSFTLLSVVDTAFLGRLGATPLAASGIAGVLFFAVVFPLSGAAVGVQALVARRFGEGRQEDCGRVAANGVAIALFLGIPLVAASPWLVRLLAPILSEDPEVVRLGSAYLRYRFLGSAFFLVNWIFRGFFAGIGETRHPMTASLLVTITNIVLDFFLIFGRGGFPAMGVHGAAIASTAAIAVGTIYFTVIALAPRHREAYGKVWAIFARHRWTGGILRLSVPVFVQRFISHGSWFIFFGVVARIGTLELAASNVIRSIFSLPVMVAVGLGTASAALVGQRLGARRPDEAEGLAWEASKLAAYTLGMIGLLFVLAPEWVFRIYTTDAAVIAVGRLPLIILGFVQMLIGVALVLSQSLQGAGNTRFVMLVELGICSLLYLPAVYVLGLRTSLGIVGAWAAEYIYWFVLAGIMSWQFRRGTWKSIVL